MSHKALINLKGIGPRRAEMFGKLGLTSIEELLRFAPREYKDYSSCQTVQNCEHGQDTVLNLTIDGQPKLFRLRRGFDILSAPAHDESGSLRMVWYNQSYRQKQIQAGMQCYACGRIDTSKGKKIVNPAVFQTLPGILPVYPLVHGLHQGMIRDAVKQALQSVDSEIDETLPKLLLDRYELPGLPQALRDLHFPAGETALQNARRRLSFEDMLTFRLMIGMLKKSRADSKGIAFASNNIESFITKLPFAPTGAQMRVMKEIASDMQAARPMNRLIQGDVGSGKTALALYAMDTAVKGGYQAVLLAPTDILARQHFSAVQAMFGSQAVLLRGAMKKSERDAVYDEIAGGKARAIVGTHALLQEGLHFASLGLVVADEQHRFGVSQRAKLGNAGTPDMLIMSATPIPRTLSLLLYGDLDISVLDELPPGRKPVETHVVPDRKREAMYAFLCKEIEKGRQAYIVCPMIESSEEYSDVPSVQELYNELKKKLPVRIALLHGQQKNDEKQETLARFRDRELDVLVSTTVIEVGIDVPNATVMIIEGADHFGLAQLHQLRGRVGRGAEASYCFLLNSGNSETARERLSILSQTQDGFEIAKKDLAMRGPGELLGKKQHGSSQFAALALAADMDILQSAQEAADAIMTDAELSRACAPVIHKAEEFILQSKKQISMN